MNKAEIQYLQEKEKARKERVKRQNEQAKNTWETVSCRLPIGTKKRIENQGFSINGLINKLILAELDKLENQEQKSPVSWDQLAEIEKQKAEKDHAELLNAPHTEPAQHGELTKALFYHGEVTKETDTSSATPDALKLQEELERRREQYRREKEAEQLLTEEQKTRIFNPSDYK
jgi:hypothetical protein